MCLQWIQYAGETDIVANVSVSNIYMSNAQNGARIKVFGGNPNANSTAGGGTGYVKASLTISDEPLSFNRITTEYNLLQFPYGERRLSDVH